jgi:putative transposase
MLKIESYKTNSHWAYSCKYHLIFATKYRRKVLNEQIQQRGKEIILGIKDSNFTILEIEVMEDHIHILMECNPESSSRYIVWKIKGTSANQLRSEFPELVKRLPCLWTNSKFIATVGTVNLDVVKQYIESQKYKAPGK